MINLPVDNQLKILEKIIPFNKDFKPEQKEINILVLYQNGFRTSQLIKNDIEKYQKVKRTENNKINYVYYSFNDLDEFQKIIHKNKINIIYIAPLRAVDLNEILAVTKKNKIMSFTGVVEYMEFGVSVVLDIKGDKPEIIINRQSAKDEGVDFSSQLLKLARIIE